MGLDQYLYAKIAYSPAEWRGEESNKAFDTITEMTGIKPFIKADYPLAEVSVNIGYWRKENAIHNWFVQNCQDGNDDCRESYVSREQLEELKRVCEIVIMDKGLLDTDETAHQLLPTASGFFFGTTDYDEWYYKGLQDTIDIVTSALEMPQEYSFSYQSSW